MKNIIVKLKNTRLIWKLLLSYILIITLPVTFFFLYVYDQSVKKVKDEYNYIFMSQRDQIVNNVNKTAEMIETYSATISQNTLLRRYLQFYINNPDYDFLMISSLSPFLKTISFSNPTIHSLHIYKTNEAIPRYQNIIFDKKVVSNEIWFSKCKDLGYTGVFWDSPHPEAIRDIDGRAVNTSSNEVLSLYRKIYSLDSSDDLGYLEVNVKSEDIFGFIHSQTNEDIHILITDKNLKPVFITENSKALPINYQLLRKSATPASYDIKMDNDRFLVLTAPLDKLELELFILYPNSNIAASVSGKVLIIILIAVLLITSIFFITYYVSNVIFKRMNKMVLMMKKVQEGDFNVQVDIDSMDEVGQINRAFNIMVQKINTLIDTVYKSKLAEKEAKLSYLQTQMNPHFLFNSLEAIRMVADLERNIKVSDALYSLSKVLRAHLKIDSLISIKEEIDIIKSYVYVQNIRFKDKLKLTCTIEHGLEAVKIPALVVEPIVENSIVHGFKYKKESCRIDIRIGKSCEDESKMLIEIIDNGAGIPEDKLQIVNRMLMEDAYCREVSKEGNGIGLHNVNERIKLYYGKEFGLELKSMPGIHNCAALTLPYPKNTAEDGAENEVFSRYS